MLPRAGGAERDRRTKPQGPEARRASPRSLEPCVADVQCSSIGPKAFCVKHYPGGMCTLPCRDGCPQRDSRPDAACVDFGDGTAYCFQRCPGATSSSCRNGSSEWACCAAPTSPAVTGVSNKICRDVGPGTARLQLTQRKPKARSSREGRAFRRWAERSVRSFVHFGPGALQPTRTFISASVSSETSVHVFGQRMTCVGASGSS